MTALLRHRLARLVPALLWMGFIYYWSSQSVLPIDGSRHTALLHRLSHVGAYGTLALLLTLGTGTSRRGRLVALVVASLYGVSDEYHQTFTPGRMGQLRDVLIDTGAAAAAMIALPHARRVLARRDGGGARGDEQHGPRRLAASASRGRRRRGDGR